MTGVVAWAAHRARMVLAFIAISLVIGGFAYVSLPKEGEPDIEIPALFVSVQFPGISAEDSENLLIKPMETELADLDGLKEMTSTAAEGYAGVALEFDFGWDKTAIMADVRDAMNSAQADFPEGAEQYSLTEINFSEFPIVIVNLTGAVPERTMARVAKDLQDELEALDSVLEAGIAGNRDEMLEVVIDPLRLEAYNVTADELINVVRNNNQLIAAGEVETAQGTFSVKIPSSFKTAQDVYGLPIKVNGDRVVTLGELAQINYTFEDRAGTARFNGEPTVALQVVKRKGFNLIDTVAQVKETIEQAKTKWPPELQAAVDLGTSNDQSRIVGSMVSQLEGSVLTAIALVMIVVLASLGTRAALLVGFAIPTSFLLCFAFLAVMGVSISNIVMFGLILAVGMLVDGAIVVVEYADKRIKQGVGPMHAYVEAAQRMFWPIVSSTATTLCAFLPMLFWPGVPGEFMGMLPVTLIFVLSASLIVALIYLPVMGGVSGRLSRVFDRSSIWLRARTPWWLRAVLVPPSLYMIFLGAMQTLNPDYLLPGGSIAGALLFLFGAFAGSVTLSAARIERKVEERVHTADEHTPFGHVVRFLVGNPIMPIVSLAAVFFAVYTVAFVWFPQESRGVEFFVESEPEQATAYVRARGNISLAEKDGMVLAAEDVIAAHPAVINVFSFAGEGGLNQNNGGAQEPADTVGRVQFEIIPWEDRPNVSESVLWGLFDRHFVAPEFDGDFVIDELNAQLAEIPGIVVEILPLEQGPASAKPVHLRIKGDGREDLTSATLNAREVFDTTPGLIKIEDTLPLPGIDWQIDVDVAKAGRFGADVATVGAMVQLVTRGILLGEMRPDSNDEEIEIRVRLPEEDRVLSTLDTLKVRTPDGLVPLSNFVSRKPVAKLAEINRVDQQRYYDVKADVEPGLSKVTTEGPDGELVRLAVVREAAEGYTPNGTVLNSGGGKSYELVQLTGADSVDQLISTVESGDAQFALINPNERIAVLTEWLETGPFSNSISWEWTGDQEEQAESGAFLVNAFMGALGLMFVILLAQFNSFYNSVLVLLAVVLSTTGVLIGMIVMEQPFSIIMTGTGIVALAGIVVNNNIVLIDTYQEYSTYMPRIEAIIRTAESRIRPVLLTTLTTMAGLTPMMFGLSLDFINGGYSIDSPTALWWKQLATAVVFGLGIATVLTLIVTPSLLALRVWVTTYAVWLSRLLARVTAGRSSQIAQDMAIGRSARQMQATEIVWEDESQSGRPEQDSGSDRPDHPSGPPLKAAE
ncbi:MULTISPECIES: efflux RND transporter permease subunit [unclassified Ruegeria]|uniref:efflux RND transporter permease subunit n=1 Tax=unclassified Ruegeria TaxID=2625375 RepID=UPI001487BFB2|nr:MULTISPECIES: efflux RND transporter permease subunit [unclassified Ruegeria]NOD77383.1 AcrB/AcrD/AcrF family protein [Ruegeria sp. HKCCD4332]NOD87806.1 AcrB/AcrD/AcrF family protein [Ruegeria sp. HKCCD4318]NOE14176.1 AcrB/AcrD/AcrF family protein [Ruegeria sp. HKCCD4318-2]NOG08467.1 efflux RND transporter permease subunit [Ruegeria sp. HKCCD4315]